MASKAPLDDGGEKVPLWYISFADMITLLLAFFVMLQTLAHTQDALEFGKETSDSFRRAIDGMGIPELLNGRGRETKHAHRRLSYSTPESTEEQVDPERKIDSQDERIRTLFAQLKKETQTQSSDMVEKPINSRTADIRFAARSAALDDRARRWLDNYVLELKQTRSSDDSSLYVVGLAPDVLDRSEALLLSAQRAAAVQEYLDKLLSSHTVDGYSPVGTDQPPWRVESAGSGKAGRWCQKFGAGAGQSYILIAVMEARNSDGR